MPMLKSSLLSSKPNVPNGKRSAMNGWLLRTCAASSARERSIRSSMGYFFLAGVAAGVGLFAETLFCSL